MKTTLRLSDDLYSRIERMAQREHRSVNAQMVHLLEEAAPAQVIHHRNVKLHGLCGARHPNVPESSCSVAPDHWPANHHATLPDGRTLIWALSLEEMPDEHCCPDCEYEASLPGES